MLSKRSLLQQKQEEFADLIRKLGAIPTGGYDKSLENKSSKQLMAEIDECHRELTKLGHVNKKALDQYANFSDQRDKLLERQATCARLRANATREWLQPAVHPSTHIPPRSPHRPASTRVRRKRSRRASRQSLS